MELIASLEKAYAAKNWSEVGALLSKALIQISTMDPSTEDHRVQLVYEIGALAGVACKDQPSFDRYMSLLFPIYFSRSFPSSSPDANPNVLLGLFLLSLLVRNCIAEFYVTLERINSAPGVDLANVYIQFPVQLQQCLNEGTYHRVILARQQVPSPDYAWFIDSLVHTIRNELASCLEKSFRTIDMPSAARLLLLSQEQVPQLVQFAQQRGWNVQDDTIVFADPSATAGDLATLTHGLIIQSLGYARELEQII